MNGSRIVVCDRRGGARSCARARLLHVRVCARLGLHDRRPAGLRELPRHERAIRRLDQEQPSLGRRVQRLSRAPRRWSPSTRRRPRNGFWHSYYFTTRHVSRANPGVAGEPGDRGGELPPLPRARRPGDGDARPRRISRHLVYPLSRIRGPYGTCRDQRRRFFEVNRVRPETKRNARLESQCRPDRGPRDGASAPRRSRHSSSTSWSGRGKRRIRSSASWS